MNPRRAYIGLGANLGDAADTLRRAAATMARWPGALNASGSSLYRSAPIDSEGPDYWNAVLAVDTAWSLESLHRQLQALERAHGRMRPYRNAPRTLDLDLLAVGDEQICSPALHVPHPRLHLRAFVLVPLLEVAPELHVPGLGSLAAWLPSVSAQRIERIGSSLL